MYVDFLFLIFYVMLTSSLSFQTAFMPTAEEAYDFFAKVWPPKAEEKRDEEKDEEKEEKEEAEPSTSKPEGEGDAEDEVSQAAVGWGSMMGE